MKGRSFIWSIQSYWRGKLFKNIYMNTKETQQTIGFWQLDWIQCITNLSSSVSNRMKVNFQKFISRLPVQQSKAIMQSRLLSEGVTVQQWLLLFMWNSAFEIQFYSFWNSAVKECFTTWVTLMSCKETRKTSAHVWLPSPYGSRKRGIVSSHNTAARENTEFCKSWLTMKDRKSPTR